MPVLIIVIAAIVQADLGGACAFATTTKVSLECALQLVRTEALIVLIDFILRSCRTLSGFWADA